MRVRLRRYVEMVIGKTKLKTPSLTDAVNPEWVGLELVFREGENINHVKRGESFLLHGAVYVCEVSFTCQYCLYICWWWFAPARSLAWARPCFFFVLRPRGFVSLRRGSTHAHELCCAVPSGTVVPEEFFEHQLVIKVFDRKLGLPAFM